MDDRDPDSLEGVTAANLGEDMPRRGVAGIGAGAPRALVSIAALRRNATRLAALGAVADLRADAWGHGVLDVARCSVAAGVRTLLIDEEDAGILAGAGIDPALLSVSPRRDAVVAEGEALYGVTDGSSPVMSLYGQVLGTKPLRAGEGVSYGYLHRAAADTRIALVTGGYAQGVVRALGETAHVVIGGRRHPIVGRVAMDVCVVDIADAEVGRDDRVTYFGDPVDGAPAVTEWVRLTGLSAAEILTTVGLRARREAVA